MLFQSLLYAGLQILVLPAYIKRSNFYLDSPNKNFKHNQLSQLHTEALR